MNISAIPDEELETIIKQGGDVHTAVAARMLGKAKEDVTPDERAVAKQRLFARLYGAKEDKAP